MFYAIVDSESLNNPTILNDFFQIKVIIQYEPLSSANKYHHNFLLKFEDDSIHNSVSEFQKEMKTGWFLFFWSESILTIVFNKQKFEVDIPINELSNAYKSAQEYGKSQEIQTEYLDYLKYFTPLYMESKKIFKLYI